MWVETSDYTITVGAGIGNRDMIESVTFWLEGASETVSNVMISPRTGAIGFCINVASRAGQNGDAHLYAQVKPVNGYSRLIGPLALVLNTDAGTAIVRDQRYVNSDAGTDSTAGATGQSAGTPWATLAYALANTPSGGIINLQGSAVHNYPAGTFSGTARARMIDVRGAGRANTTIAVVAGGDNTFKTNPAKLRFVSLSFRTDAVSQMYGNNTTTGRYVFDNCWVGHSVDPTGNLDKGYPVGFVGVEKNNAFYRTQTGLKWFFVESDVEDVVPAGVHLWRNSTFRGPLDAIQFGSSNPGSGSHSAIFNFNFRQFGNMEQRMHTSMDITVQSVSRAGSTTVITFSGSPGISAHAAARYLRVLQSTNSVPVGDIQFPINEDGSSRDFAWMGYAIVGSTANTITCTDTGAALMNLGAGDLCRGYTRNHCDHFQFVLQANFAENFENIYVQGYNGAGHTSQPILLSGGWQSTTVNDTAMASSGETVFPAVTLSQ
jgi:hypothetical protein